LEKSRGGEGAPPFAVEILYLTKTATWGERGSEKVTLPELDLPISRTGLLLYYPPLFHVTAEAGGTFRTHEYQYPVSAALGRPIDIGMSSAAPAASPTKAFARLEQFGKMQEADTEDRKDADATRALLDTFRAKSSAGKTTGILPINVTFPAFGPSIYLVSELTGENQSPAAQFNFQREKRGGVR